MVSNTGFRSPGELEMTRSTSSVAACRSSASEKCPCPSASSRVRASSCFFNSISELGLLLMRAFAFVPVERTLGPRVRLSAPLREKVTWIAPCCCHRPRNQVLQVGTLGRDPNRSCPTSAARGFDSMAVTPLDEPPPPRRASARDYPGRRKMRLAFFGQPFTARHVAGSSHIHVGYQ